MANQWVRAFKDTETMTSDNQKMSGWTVPWIHQANWQEMIKTTKHICEEKGDSRVEIMQHIKEITALYNELETPLNDLCQAACPECLDVCCTKATVWYDQKDILVYHLATGSFPEKQISKHASGICCHLGEHGCNLPRLQRPFICTWYICSAQTAIIKSATTTPAADVTHIIQQIKELRKKIISLCIETPQNPAPMQKTSPPRTI